ncbi:hypothetical protein N7519_000478 [Penicillium mononematosum]|uniref:uncharacterized protein n=1 Tax=Penicillium mononematosum TaxID=268346 RepID=UPI00254770FD|nr:uncharacterized protein N7519_000478 [Penicillium mononematosum]KAJ6190457.1 hypothetical protein N7519_000478 [Penicillium mononematosum]
MSSCTSENKGRKLATATKWAHEASYHSSSDDDVTFVESNPLSSRGRLITIYDHIPPTHLYIGIGRSR